MKFQRDGWCIHYRGLQHETCDAGLAYRSFDPTPDAPGLIKRMPCFAENLVTSCTLCRYPTIEEVEESYRAIDDHLRRSDEDGRVFNEAHRHARLVWLCEVCVRDSRYLTTTTADFVMHLHEAHGIGDGTSKIACTTKMRGHYDAREWSQDVTEYRLDDRVIALRSERTRRYGANKRAWDDV